MQDDKEKFDKWNEVKKKTEESQKKNFIEIKKIYWIKIGKNIGKEVFGKGENFARPVLVINSFFNGSFLAVPLSSKTHNKSGKLYYKFKDSKGQIQVALLGQLRVFDNKRKLQFIAHINENDFEIIKKKIKENIIK